MIKVIIKNMTGSVQKEAELHIESGAVSYQDNDDKVWDHMAALRALGWTIVEKAEKPVKLEHKKVKREK